jgi:hypothetical protein
VNIILQDESAGKGKGKGFKPYQPPRTGGAGTYFSGTTGASLLLRGKPKIEESHTGTTLIVTVLVIAGVSMMLLRRKMS